MAFKTLPKHLCNDGLQWIRLSMKCEDAGPGAPANAEALMRYWILLLALMLTKALVKFN